MTESAGAKLKNLRLQKGLSLEEAHKKTKIHLDILKAIEEDSLINFSPVYIKGFLKIYCKFLGVDPRDFIPDYKERKTTVKYVSDFRDESRAVFKIPSFNLFPFKAIRIKLKTAVAVILVVVFIIGLFNLGRIISSKPGHMARRAAATAAIPYKPEAKVSIAKPQAAPAAKTIALDIRARENCFIQVKADGRVIFQNILRKGRSESWQAKDKIELSLGNAGVVELEVNGKRISSLGRKGQSVKNILITREGLNIRR
ncbi:MAG: RodZ domain-containing protein [Candidatus Omnitrophota bacterium]